VVIKSEGIAGRLRLDLAAMAAMSVSRRCLRLMRVGMTDLVDALKFDVAVAKQVFPVDAELENAPPDALRRCPWPARAGYSPCTGSTRTKERRVLRDSKLEFLTGCEN